MKWAIAAPFIDETNKSTMTWLEPFVPGDEHTFEVIPRPRPLPDWHARKSKFTPIADWMVYAEHARRALASDADGVITVFPQLPAVVGMLQKTRRAWRDKPVVAWMFNVGTLTDGLRRRFAKETLRHIDRFVVHTTREVQLYTEWLGMPSERFQFVPYQSGMLEVTADEDKEQPFISALGSSHRDYQTFFDAVEELNITTKVVAGPGAVEGMRIPPQVERISGIPLHEAREIALRGRLNVIPMTPREDATAAGQVTIVHALMMGRPLICTRCNGAEDYVLHGETGWLVEPRSKEALREAIHMLWNDEALRTRLGQNARRYAHENFADEAAGRTLGTILSEVARGRGAGPGCRSAASVRAFVGDDVHPAGRSSISSLATSNPGR